MILPLRVPFWASVFFFSDFFKTSTVRLKCGLWHRQSLAHGLSLGWTKRGRAMASMNRIKKGRLDRDWRLAAVGENGNVHSSFFWLSYLSPVLQEWKRSVERVSIFGLSSASRPVGRDRKVPRSRRADDD